MPRFSSNIFPLNLSLSHPHLKLSHLNFFTNEIQLYIYPSFFVCPPDIRQRIELIQDFEMPGVSTSIRMSRDGNYIMAAGIYKPRIRCFEVDNLAMKFERCFDAEAVTFEILSDDYSKVRILF